MLSWGFMFAGHRRALGAVLGLGGPGSGQARGCRQHTAAAIPEGEKVAGLRCPVRQPRPHVAYRVGTGSGQRGGIFYFTLSELIGVNGLVWLVATQQNAAVLGRPSLWGASLNRSGISLSQV